MKKKIALMISAAMLLPAFPSVYAADADMEKILTEIKTRIGNTDEYDQFRSDSYESDGHTMYQFSWSKEDGSESFDVSCNDEGIITNYSAYETSPSSSDTKRIPDVSPEQAEQTAREFINRINPSISSQLTVDADEASALNSSYTVYVKRSIDGINVYNDDGYIRLNDDNTAVQYFNLNYQYVSPVSDKSSFIGGDEAKAAFKGKIGMELVYRSYTESDGNTKYFPVYVVKDSNKYIDAITGEAREMDVYRYAYARASGGSSKNEAAMDTGLSRAEIEEFDKIEGLISKEDAEKLARENRYLAVGNSIKLNSISLSRSYEDKDSYMYSLSFRNEDDTENIYVILDAADGAVISFDRYGNADNSGKENDTEKAKEITEALAGERLSSYVYDEDTESYRRYENGIRVEGDSAYAAVYDGTLYSFRIDYAKNASFPSAEGAMSAAEAADAMFGMVLYDVNYVSELDNKTGCLYIPDSMPSIDPFTGNKLNYNGEPAADTEMTYSDISGHYAQEIIEKLAVYGIGFEGGEFKPDEKITRSDYADFLEKAFGRRYMAVKNTGENSQKDNSPVTRAEAAQMMIDSLGVSEYAAYDIYKQPFEDVTENMGPVAILAAMGVVQGDENGLFNPDDDITRAEAAVMMYNYLDR